MRLGRLRRLGRFEGSGQGGDKNQNFKFKSSTRYRPFNRITEKILLLLIEKSYFKVILRNFAELKQLQILFLKLLLSKIC